MRNKVRVNRRFDCASKSVLLFPKHNLVLAIRLPVARSGCVISQLPELFYLCMMVLVEMCACSSELQKAR
jgi:hypothetical protein